MVIEAPSPTLPAAPERNAGRASDQILISGAPIGAQLNSSQLSSSQVSSPQLASTTEIQNLDGQTFGEALEARLKAEVQADQWVRGLLAQCGQELRHHGVGLIINQVELAGRAEIEQAKLQTHAAPLNLKTVSVSLKLRARRTTAGTWTLHACEEGQDPWISSGSEEQLRQALLSHYYTRLLSTLEAQLSASLE